MIATSLSAIAHRYAAHLARIVPIQEFARNRRSRVTLMCPDDDESALVFAEHHEPNRYKTRLNSTCKPWASIAELGSGRGIRSDARICHW